MFDSTVSKTCNSHHRATGRRALHHIRNLVFAFAVLLGLAPSAAWACACGCSVFDVGGGLLPQEDDHGGRVFLNGGMQIKIRIGSAPPELPPMPIWTSES
jgi:hypothetical protein